MARCWLNGGPSPRGARGALSYLGIHRGGRAELGSEVKTKETQQRVSQSHPVGQHRMGTAFRRPLGGVGGVLSAGSSPQQMKTRPRNWLLAAQLQGDLLLPKVPS